LFVSLAILMLGACDANAPEAAPTQQSKTAEADVPATAGRLDRSRAGTVAPDGTFEGPDGAPARFADFRGKPLLLNLWATWCAPCIAEMPTLDRLAASTNDIRVLALSQDMDGRAKVEAFFKERKFKSLQPYLDPELSMMSALQVATLPTTILYDAQGREVWRMTGIEDWTGDKAKKLIAEATAR